MRIVVLTFNRRTIDLAVTSFRTVLTRLADLVTRRRRADERLDEEIQSHVDALVEEYEARGMSPDAARRAARRAFGGVMQMKEAHREQRTFAFVDLVVSGLRHAARGLLRRPGTMGLALTGLAVSIGLNASIFNVLNATVFRGVAAAHPASLVRVDRASRQGVQNDWPWAEYDLLRRTSHAQLTAWSTRQVTWGTTSTEFRGDVLVHLVSGNFFEVMGGTASAGRVLTARDDQPDADLVAVVNHAFWQRYLDPGEPFSTGLSVYLDHRRTLIVGVAERSFGGPITGEETFPAFWVSQRAGVDLGARAKASSGQHEPESVNIAGRLAPSTSAAQLEAELSSLVRGVETASDGTHPMAMVGPIDRGQSATWAAILVLGFTGLVTLVAAMNTGIAFLAAAMSRRQEIATRRALGASDWRLFRHVVGEVLLLCVPSGLIGLALVRTLSRSLAWLFQVPVTIDVMQHASTMAFGAVLAAVSALVAIVPAAIYWVRQRNALADHLSDTRAGSAKISKGFLLIQAAASTFFLILGVLFARATSSIEHFDFGFDVPKITTATIPIADLTNTPPDFWQPALTTLRETAAIDSVALAAVPPFMAWPDPEIHRNRVSPEFFATLGLRMVRGRGFTIDDVRADARVAVITASVAKTLWVSAEPLGDTLERVSPRDRAVVVIGVVADAFMNRVGWPNPGTVYQPLPSRHAEGCLIVRTRGDAATMLEAVRETIRGALPPRTDVDVQALSAGPAFQAASTRRLGVFGDVLGAVALLLTVMGVSGVTMLAVRTRRREIGIRLALGARPAQVTAMVLTSGLRPVLVGVTGGVVAATLAGRGLTNGLAGFSAGNLAAVGLGAMTIVVVTLFATFAPLRVARRIEPVELVRT
jgi:predicted permease